MTGTTPQPTGTRLPPTGITAQRTGRTIRTLRAVRRHGCRYRLRDASKTSNSPARSATADPAWTLRGLAGTPVTGGGARRALLESVYGDVIGQSASQGRTPSHRIVES